MWFNWSCDNGDVNETCDATRIFIDTCSASSLGNIEYVDTID